MVTLAEPKPYDAELIRRRIETREAVVGICGLGYVGLPLAIAASAAFRVIGFDVDAAKVRQLNDGISYVATIDSDAVADRIGQDRLEASDDFRRLGTCDVIVICVPTPLTSQREPDLSFVRQTAETILQVLRPGQIIILESTTYPGTTDEVLRPLLERSDLRSGRDFFLGFSPEREDPGNQRYGTSSIPRVTSGDGPMAARLVESFYAAFVNRTVPVSSPKTAEAVKITENIFRSVNIALVNELKLVYAEMGIDIWEVIEAAATKPFGFMPFFPGPGLGGHCIPIDPFYLAWKAREHGTPTRFIELAGEINTAMPRHIVERLAEALDVYCAKSLGSAKVLVLGLSYKKNVADTRESPALKLIDLIEKRGGHTSFHDPLVPEIPPTREHGHLAGRRSVALNEMTAADHDAVVIVTDHDAVDYRSLDHARLVVDTRNACSRNHITQPIIVKA